ncbi:MAG: SUMF1/EgtB/PvdO family nonheme iron enzyme [Caldilineaceae bacterium]
MKAPAHQAWGERLLIFRQRRHYRQGELADALSFIRLPREFSASNSAIGDNITFQNYELSRFEQGHRCPRPRQRHLALIYGLTHLGCIESAAEADEWLALADQRPLNVAEQALIFGQERGDALAPAPLRTDFEIDARQLQSFDAAHRSGYLHRILHQYEYLPLQGLAATARSAPLAPHQRIGLLDVYIELDTTAKIESFDEAQNRLRMKPLAALPALVRSTRAVLLGIPGSGKSTFVNYLAYCLANHHLHPDEGWLQRHLPAWPDAWRALLPIPITLREVAAWIQAEQITQRNSRLLLDYLQSWLHQRILDEFYFVLKDHLRRGQALLLLDGLDELPDDEKVRRQIKEMIADLPTAFPQTPMLVTCRVLSYRTGHWQLDEQTWPVFELAELNDRQIRHFIDDWYQLMGAMGVVQTGGALSDKLQQAVLRPDLLRLARNPLLLMVMALVHTHKGQLPDARALLFAAVVELLLWRWEAIKLKDPDGRETTWRQLLNAVGLNDALMQQRLWALAFHIHGRTDASAGGDATADIGESELLATLRELHPNRSLDWAERLVQIIQLRAGLLVEKSPHLFGFPHRTFQEYLAACHLGMQRDFVQQAQALAERGASWYEVILLAIGYLVHCADAIERPLLLIGELCPEGAPEFAETAPHLAPGSAAEIGWHKIWLAGKALLEVGLAHVEPLQQGRALMARLRRHLTTLISHDLLEPRLRAEAGAVLSVLGDPRDFDELATVPAGPFRMGNSAAQMALFTELGVPSFIKLGIAESDTLSFLQAAAPQHEVHLAAYQIGRYPITNSQYALFVAATGHAPPEHWRGPTPPLALRNHPVVFVSWHDAQAYCRWRSQVEGRLWRLPSEAEWEKAAIGVQGTLFPWGDDVATTHLNNYAAGVGATSTVGIFAAGASPYGCFDMAGNVYEWTGSLWGLDAWRPAFAYPYQPDDGREDLGAPDTIYRVLRGGAYYLNHVFTSCTYRDRDLPTNRGRSLGFRVVAELA